MVEDPSPLLPERAAGSAASESGYAKSRETRARILAAALEEAGESGDPVLGQRAVGDVLAGERLLMHPGVHVARVHHHVVLEIDDLFQARGLHGQ